MHRSSERHASAGSVGWLAGTVGCLVVGEAVTTPVTAYRVAAAVAEDDGDCVRV